MPLAAGTRLGAYEITGVIGAGGMGEVYRARDTKLHRDVAIKVLPLWLMADPDQCARFDRTACLLATLNHPNIGAIYGVEDSGGIRALVLELVEGATLAELLSGVPHGAPAATVRNESGSAGAAPPRMLPVEEALAIARQIAEALEAAHERGIVHRDLKPANIKITSRGSVKLLDFGIATQGAFPDAETSPGVGELHTRGQIVGTVGYMSPEQARGEAVDFRSDHFSLGVILFEMLTGRCPFARSSGAETLAAVLRDGPPAIESLNPKIPPPLQWLVDRCLAKQPDDRYASTRELAKDLAILRDGLAQPPAVTGLAGKSTLPVSRTTLIGREAEVSAVCSLLRRDEVRLVTLTGTGGTGKTRLALQVAGESDSAFRGGVYFVSLASITDPGLVAATVVQAVAIREVGARDPADVLKEALGAAHDRTLLVLDNFEQLLDATPLLTTLLESCARLKVLVTSRAVLRVYGEYEFKVPPLGLPSRGAQASIDDVTRCPSVALFLQRAAAVKSDFVLTPENTVAVAEICRRLDGLPLAIELAAARVRMLTPPAMLQRLDSRFELLTGGARDLPPRQQTLWATVQWSYELLTEDEQKLFRRLAVFVNGCTLDAAEAVCNAGADLETELLDAMESLVGKSLIQQTHTPDGETRLTMLETIRDYAGRQLTSSPDETLARQAHAAYCIVLAEEGATREEPAERARWLERCDLEHDNFRVALEWAIRTNAAEWGLRLGAALLPFWQAREHYSEGRERLNALLELTAHGDIRKTRARALHAACALAHEQGDYTSSRALLEEQISLSRALGDLAGIVSALNAIAGEESFIGNLTSARSLFEECLRLSEEAGSELTVAQSLTNLAYILREEGDLPRAQALAEQALAIFVRLQHFAGAAWLQNRLGDLQREQGNAGVASVWYERARATFETLGDRAGVARTLIDLAGVAFDQGQDAKARTTLARALTMFRDMGHRRGVARALEAFACFAAKRGHAARALCLAGAADAVRHTTGAVVHSKSERASLARVLDRARQRLGDAAVAAEMQGWSITMEAAIHYALSEESPIHSSPGD
jgi:predicted ATPase/serine/threonine protein kinase